MAAPDDAAREKFLARWSRLKRAAVPEAAPDSVPAPQAEAAPAPETPPELPELPELPSLESLTAESDFSVFLHPRVPPVLRAQALARAWSLDPFIRDFKEMADYAWDWNTPGGAPGYGPLDAAEDVAEMLARILPDPPARPDPEAEPSAAEPQLATVAEEPPAVEQATQAAPAPAPVPVPAPVPAIAPPGDPPVEVALRARRHGGAMPA
jgi:hypothetical protein